MTAALVPAYPAQSGAALAIRDHVADRLDHAERALRVTFNHAYRWADCGRHVVEAATNRVLNPRGWRADHLVSTPCHGIVSADR